MICTYPDCDCAVSFPEGYRPSVATECPRSDSIPVMLTPAEYSFDGGRTWATVPRLGIRPLDSQWLFNALADAFRRIFGGDPPAGSDIVVSVTAYPGSTDTAPDEKTGLWYWLDDWDTTLVATRDDDCV